ncbi:MAG: D-lactate dehydrogenase [Alteromonas naphthalenivorans]|jgi:D-lactate dehydrogenase
MARITFYEVEPWMEIYLKEKLSKHTLSFVAHPLSDKTVSHAKKADIIAVFIYSKLDKNLMCELPNVQMIATTSTGYDHIDQKVIDTTTICNVPDYGQNTVAEHTFGLLLAIARKLITAEHKAHKGNVIHSQLTGIDLKDKTIGVIGTGNIGSHVIKIAHGFGMNILAYDKYKNPKLTKQYGVSYVPLKQLLKKSDVITLHAPLLPSTKYIINMDNIQDIKPGAILINTARGGLIETKALWTALNKKILSGAGLDVFEEECLFTKRQQNLHKKYPRLCSKRLLGLQHKIMKLANVVVTPHNAFNTKAALKRILDTTVENITAFLNNKPKNIIS